MMVFEVIVVEFFSYELFVDVEDVIRFEDVEDFFVNVF